MTGCVPLNCERELIIKSNQTSYSWFSGPAVDIDLRPIRFPTWSNRFPASIDTSVSVLTPTSRWAVGSLAPCGGKSNSEWGFLYFCPTLHRPVWLLTDCRLQIAIVFFISILEIKVHPFLSFRFLSREIKRITNYDSCIQIATARWQMLWS